MYGEEIKNFGTKPPKKEPPKGRGWVIGLIVLILALGGGWYLFQNIEPIDLPETEVEPKENEVLEYFSTTLQDTFVNEVAQPIEGFQPQMFMQVFPGLTNEDFDGVEALQGIYHIEDGELVFIDVLNGEPPHSAGQAISEEGMETLFNNVMERYEITNPTKEVARHILELLDEAPRGEEMIDGTDQEE